MALLRNNARDEIASAFSYWSDNLYNTVVVSCEDLSGASDLELQMLSEAIARYDVAVVFYVRRWAELLPSAWNEFIRHGDTVGLLENVAHTLTWPDRSTFINIQLQVEPLVKAFGRTSVKLVPYNVVIDEGRNLFNHFANRFLGSPKAAPATAHRVNVSLKPAILELVRILNFIDQKFGGTRSNRMASLLTSRTDLDISKTLEYMDKFKKSVLLKDELAGVREVIESNWQDYHKLLVIPSPVKRFYVSADRRASYISPEYALAPGFPETVRSLREELLRAI